MFGAMRKIGGRAGGPGHKAGAHATTVGEGMHEYKRGALHSGSKKGPIVGSRKQAVAIGLSEMRRAGAAKRKPPPPVPISRRSSRR